MHGLCFKSEEQFLSRIADFYFTAK